MDVFDRVYYTRAIAGIVAGIIAGSLIQVEYDQETSVGIAVFIGIAAYFVSFEIIKRTANNVPRDKRRKVYLDGIIPFMFLFIVFMIMVYTAIHQSILIK